MNGAFAATDNMRLDRREDAASFSISFPNYRMFYRKRQFEMPGTAFAVILIDINVLQAIHPSHVAYFWDNAANRVFSDRDFEEFTTIEAVQDMFADTPTHSRVEDRLPSNFTTYPQAEVMIKDIVPPDYITVIHVNNRQDEIRTAGMPGVKNVICNGTLFAPRCDYYRWKANQEEA